MTHRDGVHSAWAFLASTALSTVQAALVALAVVSAFVPTAGFAVEADASLLPYAVNVLRTPLSRHLYGVYLGKGLILTAAHVVGGSDPWVGVAGKLLPSHTVKRGNFNEIDLTVVRVDERELPVSLRIRRMPICEQAPWSGEKVIVAIPEGTARSEVMSPLFLPANARAYDTVIKDVATTGASGSGVFDLGQKCLLGIMSRKITATVREITNGTRQLKERDIAKHFVPASLIAKFIPPDLRW